jgi:HPt (histidine-containing phosphotransfer) domain-containing protein
MVDWARVRQLEEEIGEEDFAEVVQMFLEETDAAVARLAAGLTLSEVEAILHFLKGSSINLGLATLARVCAAGEKTAAAGRPEEVDLRQIAEVYARLKFELMEGLAARRAA